MRSALLAAWVGDAVDVLLTTARAGLREDTIFVEAPAFQDGECSRETQDRHEVPPSCSVIFLTSAAYSGQLRIFSP
jgi:hypothetical protein